MYSLPYFKEADHDQVIRFMHDHPFVTLCGADAAGNPVATHVPVLVKHNGSDLYLQGHFMRNTDHHRAFMDNPAALVLFQGPHVYVSASWYTDPRQGSTWNYLAVHARGNIRFLDHEALIQILRETTAHFENNEHSPASFDNLPADYVARMTKAIVPFEIGINTIDNVFKLSQNRDKQSFHNIINKLEGQNEQAGIIAAEMKKRADQLYKTE